MIINQPMKVVCIITAKLGGLCIRLKQQISANFGSIVFIYSRIPHMTIQKTQSQWVIVLGMQLLFEWQVYYQKDGVGVDTHSRQPVMKTNLSHWYLMQTEDSLTIINIIQGQFITNLKSWGHLRRLSPPNCNKIRTLSSCHVFSWLRKMIVLSLNCKHAVRCLYTHSNMSRNVYFTLQVCFVPKM